MKKKHTSLCINIDTASTPWKKAFPKLRIKIEQAAAVAFLFAKKPAAFKNGAFEINILLTTDAAIKKFNHEYRGKNKATNVLSFPQRGAAQTGMLGDIALALQTIKKECREQKKTLENHTVHLVVHGVLHLLGYDHMVAKDAKTMEKLECDILSALGYPDPYHATDIKKGKKLR